MDKEAGLLKKIDEMELKIIKTLAMLPGQASGSMACGQNLFPTSSFCWSNLKDKNVATIVS